MDEFFFTGINTICFTPETHAHACILYKMYGRVSISSRHGRLHGRGRLHGSNVLTCCTWMRKQRVGVISDGRYYELLRYLTSIFKT